MANSKYRTYDRSARLPKPPMQERIARNLRSMAGTFLFYGLIISIGLLYDIAKTAVDPCYRAEKLVANGKSADAEKIYLQVLDKDPKSSTARIGLGIAYLRSGKPALATSELEIGRKQLEQSGEGFSTCHVSECLLYRAYINLGSSYYDQKKYDKSIEMTSKILANSPDCDAFFLRATALHDSKQLKKAEKDLNDAIANDANNGRSPEERFFHERALVLADQGRNKEALADYQKALGISQCATAYRDRALFYKSMNNLKKCREDLDSSIKSDPKMESAYHERARLSMEEGRSTEALADLAAAEKNDPSCTSIKHDREIIERSLKVSSGSDNKLTRVGG